MYCLIRTGMERTSSGNSYPDFLRAIILFSHLTKLSRRYPYSLELSV